MARHHRKHHRRRRHNPFGVSGGVVKDAAWVLGGALGASALPGMVAPSLNSGWTGVAATGAAAVGVSIAVKMFGGPAAAGEALKGGLAVTVLRALHTAGFAKNLGLGMYAPSWFGVPTASSQYLVASGANVGPYRRGGGTIFFPGPGGMSAPPAAVSGLAYHRFRSRYAGGYG
jgi:hypothetical protein